MHKLLFVDLDDTLFHSHNKRTPNADATPMAYLQDGSVISYANTKQMAMLQFWQQHYAMIPVTARNLSGFKRVDIAFEHGAVVDYGGIVLHADGSIDDGWRQQSEAAAASCVHTLDAIAACLEAHASTVPAADLYVRIVSDVDIPFYTLLKSRTGDLEQVAVAAEMIRAHCAEQQLDGYQVHHNSNNLAIMPPWLNKRHGVNYLLEQWRQRGEVVTFGMGDSVIDLGFMRECDYMIVPNPSQIADLRMQA